jgi:hypothetical protein
MKIIILNKILIFRYLLNLKQELNKNLYTISNIISISYSYGVFFKNSCLYNRLLELVTYIRLLDIN